MFMHMFKPIWKRKSRNLMLSLELLLAFLIVFAVTAFAVRYYQLYHLPVGFAHANVWSVELEIPEDAANELIGKELDNAKRAAVAQRFQDFSRALSAMPEVEGVAFADYLPYTRSRWSSEFYLPESKQAQLSNVMGVSDAFFPTLDMRILKGRWFDPRDDGTGYTAAVINSEFARHMFPNLDPLGQLISPNKPGENKAADNEEEAKDKMLRVVGVFEDFRNQGEYMSPVPFTFTRFDGDAKWLPNTILLKLKAGTPRIFEVKLNQQLKLIRSNWGYRVAPLSALRENMLSTDLIPLIVLAVIATFLLLMVAFGLFGVLWQNTTLRIPEIGLRRAVGASARWIYAQIIIEQLILTSLAITIGAVLLVQLPITGALGAQLNWTVFTLALMISMALLLLLSTMCALYPAWRASRMTPTAALRYA